MNDYQRGIMIAVGTNEKNVFSHGEKLYNTRTLTVTLCVSAEECEWEMERKKLKTHYVYAYSLSDYCPSGEFGNIMINPVMGGLMRIA